MVGIGCFAESNILHRVFKKALQDYSLSQYEDFCPIDAQMVNDEHVTRFFRSVMMSGIAKPDHANRALELVPVSAKITGFFLGLNQQTLHLIVFFLNDGYPQTKFITRLEKFTRQRYKHLH